MIKWGLVFYYHIKHNAYWVTKQWVMGHILVFQLDLDFYNANRLDIFKI